MRHPLADPIPARHVAIANTWRPGQRWETKVDDTDVWVPVSNGGYGCPLWSDRQSYRLVAGEASAG